jgi:hypothetical protein
MTSKFDGILRSARGEGELSEPPGTPPVAGKRARNLRKVEDSGPAQRGRPRAKHSDPSFQQVTAYVRKDTYKAVKIALLQKEAEQEFSELVERLLADWLRMK